MGREKSKYQILNNPINAHTSILNLPDVDEFPGVKFILETVEPPKLNHRQLHEYGQLKYYKRDLSHQSRCRRFFSTSRPYYYEMFWYRSVAGSRVSCTRKELAFAWVTALNASRYHNLLKQHIRLSTNVSLKNANQDNITKLNDIASMWLALLREIDWASGILWQSEREFAIMPTRWKPIRTNLQSISKLAEYKEKLHCESKTNDLTGIFIWVIIHIIDLVEVGQDKAFLKLGNVFGFKGVKVCVLPGIPETLVYDEDSVLTCR